MRNKISNHFVNHLKEAHTYKKKIALVANTAWSVYNFRIDIIRCFISHGYIVHVIAPRDTYVEKLIAEGVHYINLPLSKYSLNPLKDLFALVSLIRTYRTEQYDFVFHYTIKPNIYGSIAARIAGIKSKLAVVTGLGRMIGSGKTVTTLLTEKLYRFAMRYSDQVWFLNVENREYFIRKGITPASKTQLLPSEGINTEKYSPKREWPKTKAIRFLFAGRLLKEKGIVEYYRAAQELSKKYKHVRFEILGFVDEQNTDSITLTELKKWQVSGAIRYLGASEDVRPFIDRCDCVVFPSYYQEGISRILLEAASMAKPIVTTDHIGCRDVVLPALSGYLSIPKDINSLKENIEKIITLSSERRLQMGHVGREYVKKLYDIELVKKIYLDHVEPEADYVTSTQVAH